MYNLYYNSSSNGTTYDNSSENWSSRITYHREMAQNFSDAVLDLHWDAEKSCVMESSSGIRLSFDPPLRDP